MFLVFNFVKKYAIYLAFLQVWAAVLGSLYSSEIKGLTPCFLCWVQRIFMYPLIVLFTVAILRKDKNVAYYVLPLSVTGAFVGLYQYLLQMTPLSKVEAATCSATAPCSAIQIMFFGFITIPFLSMTAFIVISALMLIILKTGK
ncbi:hypothetical protein A3D07_02895 [Candidatus Curtissbacteria bacterium RIFCSPHIGHO2_02_FULL_42_15]|uniref:2-oxoglutarate dehydrogenase n=1 Tax=Candidatus Curtissbacteria bacterium RIFCSPHIGHO2_02_FULL_42_15 TaxID=1797716 RepID=A0A1F5GDA0_9BACT|nr:MAG: hypothetical protein A3D07_02895 [Candidatus Curtissbacteria bacterium RIFCSPHIGHO2_02_FULL_42_15]